MDSRLRGNEGVGGIAVNGAVERTTVNDRVEDVAVNNEWTCAQAHAKTVTSTRPPPSSRRAALA